MGQGKGARLTGVCRFWGEETSRFVRVLVADTARKVAGIDFGLAGHSAIVTGPRSRRDACHQRRSCGRRVWSEKGPERLGLWAGNRTFGRSGIQLDPFVVFVVAGVRHLGLVKASLETATHSGGNSSMETFKVLYSD